MADRVTFVEGVSDFLVASVIDDSVAVVRPTILGPTNYPPLEALARSKPVIVSDVHELDDLPLSGDYVANPFSPEWWRELTEKLLVQRGRLTIRHATSPQGTIEEAFRRVYRCIWLVNR